VHDRRIEDLTGHRAISFREAAEHAPRDAGCGPAARAAA